MSTKYKFHDQDQLYFVSFWLSRWLTDLHSKVPASGARVHSAFGLCAAYSRWVGELLEATVAYAFDSAGMAVNAMMLTGKINNGDDSYATRQFLNIFQSLLRSKLGAANAGVYEKQWIPGIPASNLQFTDSPIH